MELHLPLKLALRLLKKILWGGGGALTEHYDITAIEIIRGLIIMIKLECKSHDQNLDRERRVPLISNRFHVF